MPDGSSLVDRFRDSPQLPTVDPEDLKRIRDYFREARAKLLGTRGLYRGEREEPTFGVQDNLIAEHLSPGADAQVVFMRFSLLEMLARKGLLNSWQHGEELEDFVYKVFATYPFGLGHSESKLDVDALLQHIRDSKPNP